jgi:hypothetical protein
MSNPRSQGWRTSVTALENSWDLSTVLLDDETPFHSPGGDSKTLAREQSRRWLGLSLLIGGARASRTAVIALESSGNDSSHWAQWSWTSSEEAENSEKKQDVRRSRGHFLFPQPAANHHEVAEASECNVVNLVFNHFQGRHDEHLSRKCVSPVSSLHAFDHDLYDDNLG